MNTDRHPLTALFTSPWSLFPALVLVLFVALDLPLYDVDEGAFSEATREMLESGNYLTTTLNGAPRHDKPILIYWLQAASVTLFGLNEVSLRLPSVIASLFWVLALYRFTEQFTDRQTATVTGLIFCQALLVGMVVRSATADALLNLFLSLALFDIYRYYQVVEGGRTPSRWLLPRVYLWMGLGLLTKGPVAVAVPLLVSAIFFVWQGNWRAWVGAVFSPLGWAVLLMVAGPWYLAVLMDPSSGFLEGFILKHNVSRFTDTMEGHGGLWWYYLIVLPLVLTPFTGLFVHLLPLSGMSGTGQLRRESPLQRFLWIWFVVVFILFSFSATQLPHYILYGAIPLFLLMAMFRDRLQSHLLAYLVPLLTLLFLFWFPEILQMVAARSPENLYQQELVEAVGGEVTSLYRGLMAAFLLLLVAYVVVDRARTTRWQGLMFAGFLQLVAVNTLLLPMVFNGYQLPVKEAAAVALQQSQRYPGALVSWGSGYPSFSVYAQQVVENRIPQTGEMVLIRVDKLEELEHQLTDRAVTSLYRRGGIALLGVD